MLANRVLVMSKDPGKISREVPVDIYGPRDISLIKEASFHNLKNEILDDLIFSKKDLTNRRSSLVSVIINSFPGCRFARRSAMKSVEPCLR